MTTMISISERPFGQMPDGTPVVEYTLTNAIGSQMVVINLGGIVREIRVPDQTGKLINVNLGYDDVESYLTLSPFFGALVGRVGNRIANAVFTLDGKTYSLAANNGPNNLHGGPIGFDKRVWQATPFENEQGPGLELRLLSADGDQGFPGNLSVEVRYQWTHDNKWTIDYRATTDAATPVNLTQHAYFNLNGEGDVLDQWLELNSSQFTPVDEVQIPTQAGVSVAGTAFDFRKAKTLGQDIKSDDPQIKIGSGYDHNFLIDGWDGKTLKPVGKVWSEKSGIELSVFTTEPGVQLYTGNFLDGSSKNSVRIFEQFAGFCLETQHLPDSPNQPEFPSVILRPGEVYQTHTHYQFSVKR